LDYQENKTENVAVEIEIDERYRRWRQLNTYVSRIQFGQA
jgi:hypothetical protein